MRTHWTNTKGETKEIEAQHASYLRNAAAKMRSTGSHPGDLADHLEAVAARKDAEFEAAYLAEHGTPYVKKADRK